MQNQISFVYYFFQIYSMARHLYNLRCRTNFVLFLIFSLQINICYGSSRKGRTLSIFDTEMMVGPKRPKFVLFGASIVQFSFIFQGWGAILADLYSRRADIILRGYAGWNSTRALQVIKEVFPLDVEDQPSLVIVYFGGNDSKQMMRPNCRGFHVPLPQYITNMEQIIDHFKGFSERTHLLFLGTPPVNVNQIVENFGDDQCYTNESCGRYSAALIDLCQRKDVKVVDLWTAIQQHPNWEDVCFTDGIHFTHEGSKIVVREILKVLKQADWSPSLFWKSMPVEYSDIIIVPKWQQEWDF